MDLIKEIKQRMSITGLLSKLGLQMNASGFVHSIYKEDKTPSMKIYPDENRYFCFATNNGGDVINFYQDFYRLDTSTAVKELAGLCGVDTNEYQNIAREPANNFQEEINKINIEIDQLKQCLSPYELSLYEESYYKQDYGSQNEAHISALKEVQVERLKTNRKIFEEFYNYTHTYFNQKALAYLTDARKLNLDTVSKFKICTINNYFQLNNHLKKKFNIDDLQRSGLFSSKGNLLFAKYNIVIPYLFKDSIIYLRGRYFDNDGNHEPVEDKEYQAQVKPNKYLGLRNDKVDLNRTKRFFNSDIIRTMLKGERLFIVEGEFDAMALTQMGYNAIAVPGASNMPDKKYFIPLVEFDIYLCVDNDEAGNGLRERLLSIFSEFDKSVSIKKIPTKDVNEFLASE